MFENLTDKLERSFKILKGEGRITEINVAETLKEIRRALIDADVNYKVAKSFTDQVKQKALGQDVLKAVKPGQMMTKIVRDELAELMGGTATDIRLEGNPAVILIAVCKARVRPPSRASSRHSSKARKAARYCWWQATYTVPRPSTS